MSDKKLEELTEVVWLVVKLVGIGIGVAIGLCLILWACIASVTVVYTLLGGVYAFALGTAMFAGVAAACIYMEMRR